eukprot:3523829-Amphidinium_carterae.1
MEIKVAYKQTHRTVIENKSEYKQDHFHDYSVITIRVQTSTMTTQERSTTQTTHKRTTDSSSSYYSTIETDFNTYFNGQ